MTKSELLARLQEEGIPADSYSLEGGLPNDKLCIEKTCLGWEVYYSERGARYQVEVFPTPEEAHQNLYKRLKEMMKYL